MRTLKKTLCLVLALAMVLSLGVTGVFAATEYPDLDQSKHQEAVAVVSAIGVIGGNADGTLNATGTLTRAEGARILYSLMGRNAATAGNSSTSFTDVPSSHWASAYIAYANAQGILHGVGNKRFDPEGTLTGYAFAKMLLGALGYDYEKEGITAETWELDTYKLMSRAGLDTDLVNNDYEVAVTRDEAFQMTFNSLTATMVDYKGGVTVGGVVINADRNEVGSATEDADDSYTGKAGNAAGGTPYTQLCERYFPNLKLDKDDTDDLGRGANGWTYKGEDVIKAANNSADLTFVVTKTAQKASVQAAVSDVKSSYRWPASSSDYEVYIEGVQKSSNTDGTLMIGDEVEVYLSKTTANEIDKVVVIRYYGAKLTADATTKASGDTINVNVPQVTTTSVPSDRITGYSGLVKDDVVYYCKGQNDASQTTYHIVKAESVNGQLTKITGSGETAKYTINGTDYLINEAAASKNGGNIGGLNSSTEYNKDYVYYLDPNNNIIAADVVTNTLSDYVVIDDISYVAGTGSLEGSRYVEARLVKMDGTTEIVKVISIDNGTTVYGGVAKNVNTTSDTKDTNNNSAPNTTDTLPSGADKWLVWYDTNQFVLHADVDTEYTQNTLFTYETTSSGEYKLTKAAASGATYGGLVETSEIEQGKAAIKNGAYQDTATAGAVSLAVDDDTVFIIAKEKDGSDHTYTAYTGKDNVPGVDINAAGTAVKAANTAYEAKNGVATFVFVGAHNGSTEVGNSIYIVDQARTTTGKSADGKYNVKYYTAIVDGEVKEVAVESGEAGTVFATNAYGLYEPTYDGDTITSLSTTNTTNYYVAPAAGYIYRNGALLVGTSGSETIYTVSRNTPVYFVELDAHGGADGAVKSITQAGERTAANLKTTRDANDLVAVIRSEASKNDKIDYIVVYEVEDDDDGGVVDGPTLASITVGAGKATGLASLTGTTGKIFVKKDDATINLTITPTDTNDTITVTATTITLTGNLDQNSTPGALQTGTFTGATGKLSITVIDDEDPGNTTTYEIDVEAVDLSAGSITVDSTPYTSGNITLAANGSKVIAPVSGYSLSAEAKDEGASQAKVESSGGSVTVSCTTTFASSATCSVTITITHTESDLSDTFNLTVEAPT